MDEMGEYCDNAFASCVAGRCVCQKFGIDPCTCLVSLGGCHMTRENKEEIAIATLINNDSLKYISCVSKISTSTEVHVIAMKYGIASPELTNVNVNISNRNTDKAVVLVLVSDRLVFWKINIWHDQKVDQLVLVSKYV
ncbi:uncharacterized protein LOC117112194 [Anneissia japonica]|uniref:uncharacterized protein LOC117112194 n=1 Tax=Anneissia japonica TaxID=1529436 RepID=UPI00142575B8|nr:uncharacterized protein LOC117112194 [Anneissia japonica]